MFLLKLVLNDWSVQEILERVKKLEFTDDEKAPIFKNLPPVSGALYWTNGLLERIREPMEKLSKLSQSIQDREEFKDVQKLYNSLCKNLKEY